LGKKRFGMSPDEQIAENKTRDIGSPGRQLQRGGPSNRRTVGRKGKTVKRYTDALLRLDHTLVEGGTKGREQRQW